MLRVYTKLSSTIKQLHSSAVCNTETKAMRKILKGSSVKKKHKFIDTPALPTPDTFSKGAFEGKRSTNTKRTAVLNKLFMRHITDLMASGTYSTKFAALGLEINKVNVSPDYKTVHVYWLSKLIGKNEFVDKFLEENAYQIRHELTQLRIMGSVPNIKFVQDTQFAELLELDRRLAIADFGNDFVPSEPSLKLKTELQLQMKLGSQIKEQIEGLIEVEELDDSCTPFPEMPQNVLGLDHAAIIQRVQNSLKKRNVVSKYVPSKEIPHTINENPVQYSSNRAQNLAFKEFLHKRIVMRMKSQKQEKNISSEKFYYEEIERQRKNEPDDFNFDMFYQDEDYFDEDDQRGS